VTIRRLIGVYNARGTFFGELAYVIGRRLGRAHCALCDITHGRVRPKEQWLAMRRALPVRFETYHLDDLPPAVEAISAGRAPVVVAETEDGLKLLLGPAELEACAGSTERLAAALDCAVHERGLAWPSDVSATTR
jgi:hypothetical protein